MSDRQPLTYEIIDLESAKEFLKTYTQPVIMTNPHGSSRYYGMRVLDYMFKELSKEFLQITDIIVNVDDDHAALFTAIKLGYKNIKYSGDSQEAKMILRKHGII
jgi:hypothetical protein